MTDLSQEAVTSKLIDIQAAASRLGVSPRFMRRLVSERRIAFFKVGKYIRFDPDELDRWILQCRVAADEPDPSYLVEYIRRAK